ncbi:hypothetical protein A2307_05020 [Candidatus Peregrinibacteria bacterium RIFOXYB2_FULL_33_20]|nr:MAG: hypothetical protein A2307_05020 [Candidatus Peregrinibacteria bacterium RIFOXYB2_FULL_33_20]
MFLQYIKIIEIKNVYFASESEVIAEDSENNWYEKLQKIRNLLSKSETGKEADQGRVEKLKRLYLAATSIEMLRYRHNYFNEISYGYFRDLGLQFPSYDNLLRNSISNINEWELFIVYAYTILSQLGDLSDTKNLGLDDAEIDIFNRQKDQVLTNFDGNHCRNLRAIIAELEVANQTAISRGKIRNLSLLRHIGDFFDLPDTKEGVLSELIPRKAILCLMRWAPDVSFSDEEMEYAKKIYGIEKTESQEEFAIDVLYKHPGKFNLLNLSYLYLSQILRKTPSVQNKIEELVRKKKIRIKRFTKRAFSAAAIGSVALGAINLFPKEIVDASRGYLGADGQNQVTVNSGNSVRKLRYRALIIDYLTTPVFTAEADMNKLLSEMIDKLKPSDDLLTLRPDNVPKVIDFYEALDGWPDFQKKYLEDLKLDDSIGGELNQSNYKQKLSLISSVLEKDKGEIFEILQEKICKSLSLKIDITTEEGEAAFFEIIGTLTKFHIPGREENYKGFDRNRLLENISRMIFESRNIEAILYDGVVHGKIENLLKLSEIKKKLIDIYGNDIGFYLELRPGLSESDINFKKTVVDVNNFEELESQTDQMLFFLGRWGLDRSSVLSSNYNKRPITGMEIKEAYFKSLDFSRLPLKISSDKDAQAVQKIAEQCSSADFLEIYLSRVKVDLRWFKHKTGVDFYISRGYGYYHISKYLEYIFKGIKLTDKNTAMWSSVALSSLSTDTFQIEYDNLKINNITDFENFMNKLSQYKGISPQFAELYLEGSQIDFADSFFTLDIRALANIFGCLNLQRKSNVEKVDYKILNGYQTEVLNMLVDNLLQKSINRLVSDHTLDIEQKLQRLAYLYQIASIEGSIPLSMSYLEAYREIFSDFEIVQFRDPNKEKMLQYDEAKFMQRVAEGIIMSRNGYEREVLYNNRFYYKFQADKASIIISAIDMSESVNQRVAKYLGYWTGETHITPELVDKLLANDKYILTSTSVDNLLLIVTFSLNGKLQFGSDYLSSLQSKQDLQKLGRLWDYFTEDQKKQVWDFLNLKGELNQEKAQRIMSIGMPSFDRYAVENGNISLPILTKDNAKWIVDLVESGSDFAKKLKITDYPGSFNTLDEINIVLNLLSLHAYLEKSPLANLFQDGSFLDKLIANTNVKIIADLSLLMEIDREIPNNILKRLVEKTRLVQADILLILELRVNKRQSNNNFEFVEALLTKYFALYRTFDPQINMAVLKFFKNFQTSDFSHAMYVELFERLDLRDIDLTTEEGRAIFASLYYLYPEVLESSDHNSSSDDEYYNYNPDEEAKKIFAAFQRYTKGRINFRDLRIKDRFDLIEVMGNDRDNVLDIAFTDFVAPRSLDELETFDLAFDKDRQTRWARYDKKDYDNNSEDEQILLSRKSRIGERIQNGLQVSPMTCSMDNLNEIEERVRLAAEYDLKYTLKSKINIQLQQADGKPLIAGTLSLADIDYNFKLLEFIGSISDLEVNGLENFHLNIVFGSINKEGLGKIGLLMRIFGVEKVLEGTDFNVTPEMLDDLNLLQEMRGMLREKFLYAIARTIESINISTGNLEENINRVINIWNYRPSGYDYENVTSDVSQIFRLTANFIMYRIFDSKKIDQTSKDEAYRRFVESGVIVEDPDSFQKVRQRGANGVSYARKRVVQGLTQAFNESLSGKDVDKLMSRERLKQGFKMFEIKSNGQKIGQLILGDPNEGARAALAYSSGKSLSQEGIDSISSRQHGVTAFQAVAPYTTGSVAKGILVRNGEVKSDLIQMESGLDGFVIMYGESSPFYATNPVRIVHKDNLKVSDITGNMSDNGHLNLRKPTDYLKFLDLAGKHGISLFQQHLLVSDKKSQITKETSEQAERRAIVTFADGTFGLLNFDSSTEFTFTDMVYVARKLGVEFMVNCDTGYYNVSQAFKADGKIITLGDESGAENTYNAFIGVSVP